jgi:2'-5' RNA ligase
MSNLPTTKVESFNIALFAVDKQVIDENIRLAQENFSSQAEEYLLGNNAWPHITLSQFTAESNRLPEIWSVISQLNSKPLSINLSQFYIWLYEEKYWVGLGIMRHPELIALQLAVFEALAHLGIEGLQKPSTYFPHITWARCSSNKPPLIKILPTQEFWTKAHLFKLSIGQSSPYGIYRKLLLSAE